MAEIDDLDGVGCSANDRRWKYLIHLIKLLSEEKVQLEELVNEVEKPDAILDHGFLKKGKRSPRYINNISIKPPVPVRVDPNERTEKKSSGQIKIIFRQTIKKTTDEVPETSESLESSLGRNPIFRNPIFTCKRKKGFENRESSSRKKSKGRIMDDQIMSFPNVEPTLSDTFKNRIVEIGGCLESVVFVIEKGLYVTDVSAGHGRLSVPVRQVKNKFLESDEVEELKLERGIRAALLQPCQEECEITLKYWKSNLTYVLLNGWNNVLRDNGLTEGIVIRLWSFRRNSELCFALESGYNV